MASEIDRPLSASRINTASPVREAADRVEPRKPIRESVGPPLLLFEQVSKWYGSVIGVNQVTLELRSGITGLVGANGAGKSTLLRLATGQLRPDIGTVTVAGIDTWNSQAKRLVGYCPDLDVFYEEMSGRQFVHAMAQLCGYASREAKQRTDFALHRVGMADRCDRRIRGYSKGMRQRIKLAQALLHDPQLLILDEPMSGIDPIGRLEFVELCQKLVEQGKCLLISSHELDELEKLTDHVAIMARGRVAAVGTLIQIRELLDNYPLSIRIDVPEPRAVAGQLLECPDVVSIDLGGCDASAPDAVGTIVIRAMNPRRFLQSFNRLVIEEGIEIRRLEPLDDSAKAILGYLLRGR
jgi:ABC-2 type transport system ATP-binding protein